MLKVSESVNGKFDIVLSDGYRTQLHNKGKAPAKSDLNGGTQTRHRIAKATNKAEQVNNTGRQRPKTRKSSKNGAHSDKRLSGKETLIMNKYGNTFKDTSDNTGKQSLASNKNAAFVTKNDLESLLEALTDCSNRDIPKELAKTHKTTSSDVQDKEINSSNHDKTTTCVKVADNLQGKNIETEKQPQRLQSIIEPVTHTVPTTCQNDTTSYVSMEITKPSAMRSSFAIGAPGLVINDLHEDKAARHKDWFKQLELQIQEKKEREQVQKKIQSSDVFQIETERNVSIANKIKMDDCSIRTVGETSQQQKKTENLTGHVRGRGLMSIMVSTDETQRQRQKIFEHQKAIELQVEDRKRQKREERERRLREEAMEDDRLAKERAELQKQFEEDSRKTKEKEEQAERRARVLHEGISKAHQSAQQLKREKMRNRSLTSATEENKLQMQSNTLTQSGSSKLHGMVPPLALSRSYSPSDTNAEPNHNTTARLSHSMSKIKPNSLSVRDLKSSYSDPGSSGLSRDLIHKWVEEDVGSSCLIDKNHVYDSRQLSSTEVMIPFHRTSSATFFTETPVSSQENNENVSGNAGQVTVQHGENRKHHKKHRLIPEIHPTRTSLLREKATVGEKNNSSLMGRRYKETARASQISSQKSSCGEKETKNSPTHLLSQYTPTPHQEKILEQLSTLRKGLLIKDQELNTRIFEINEYEIST